MPDFFLRGASGLTSKALYVEKLLQESEQVARQTGTALGRAPRLAAKVAAPPQALSPNVVRERTPGSQGGASHAEEGETWRR
jgi:hypothetical protein